MSDAQSAREQFPILDQAIVDGDVVLIRPGTADRIVALIDAQAVELAALKAQLAMSDEWLDATSAAVGLHRNERPFLDDAVQLLASRYNELVAATGGLPADLVAKAMLLAKGVLAVWQSPLDQEDSYYFDEASSFIGDTNGNERHALAAAVVSVPETKP